MKVYRIQSDTGFGLYEGGGSRSMKTHSWENQPGPTRDPGLAPYFVNLWFGWGPKPGSKIDYWDLRFAFADLDQLMAWLPLQEDRAALKRLGYTIAVFEADQYILGEKQVVFDLNRAREIERIDLDTLPTTTKETEDA